MTSGPGAARAFGRRTQQGNAPLAYAGDMTSVRSFGARTQFRVLTAAELQRANESRLGDATVANLAAAVSVAAVLISSTPASAEDIAPGAGSPDSVVTETIGDASVPPPAAVQAEVADAAAVQADAVTTGRDLYLEVIINGVSTGLVGHFRELADGGLSSESKELVEVGLKPVAEATGEDGWVRVDQLPGVEYRIDEENQQLHVTTGMEGRATRDINLGDTPSEDRLAPVASWGGLLNYSLYASSNSLTRDEGDVFEGVSGSFDARLFGPLGALNQSFTAGYSDGEVGNFVRLNTTWSYSDVNRMLTYRAGDFVSGGLTWTRPVYLGGFQIQRNFSLRSDLVTMPLPSFKGTAAVPSTLEVYTQNAQTYSAPVGEGPFELSNLPVYSGSGEARVVLRDAQGRETETTLPFYASSQMLKQGLVDFSVEAGMPRRNYGAESFDYDERVYGVASARYGLTNWLTLEAHAEGGEDLINGGVGAVFPLAHFGVGTVAVAGSHHDGQSGGMINATAELSYNDWTFYGRIQRSFGEFHDIASVTANVEADHPALTDALIFSPAVPKAVEQVAVSVPMPLDFSNLNLSYTHIEGADGKESQVLGVSYSQTVFDNVSLYASAFADLEQKDSFGVFAGLSMQLGKDYSASAGIDATQAGSRVLASVAKSEKLENGNFSWRAQTAEGGSPFRSASATYRSPWARFEAGVQQADKDVRVTGQVDGAIAVAGGGVFATNRIDDAFAVVDVGAADVEVLHENRKYGKTNSRGKIIVTGLNSYEKNNIAIDPRSLPVDAAVPATKEMVIPANQSAVVVDFGVKTDIKAALVNLVDASGAPLDVGLSGKLDGASDEFVVGYDGQAYIDGLGARNRLLVNLGDGGTCQAEFTYQSKKGEQAVVDGVVCR